MKIGDRDLIKKGFNGNVPVPVEHIYEVWMYKPDMYDIGANNISALADIGSAPAILRRQTRAAPATELKPVVEETLTKKNISKDDLSLSDIFDQGNLNKFKEIGSKFDPSFNSKIDSLFNRGGGGSPAPASSGGMGGLGGLSGLGNLGGFGGGGSGGMPNFGSLASAFGGNGGTGGLNLNQFLGSNGLSNFFKKSGDKSPSSPTNPNPYPYNPNYPSSNPSYPSSNPSNPPAYNPNYPPPSSGSLYPTLPKDPPPAVPLSNPTNNNNRGSVSLGDIFGMGTAGLTRGTDVAKPNNNPSNYDISFGEIFGFGGSKNKNQNPNYPDNNHRPSTGGVSLKDIFNFGTKKDESKNSYVPSYGTIGGGGMEPSKTRPKSSFDEISEGLGLSIDPDPIVRNNKPIIELNQANQKAAGSLNSQRTSSNTYASRKPASESAYDAQRAVEEQIVQSTKVRRSRRSFNSRGTIKYQQRDGDEALFNLQNTRKVGVDRNGDRSMLSPYIVREETDIPSNFSQSESSDLHEYDIKEKSSFPLSENDIIEHKISDDEYFRTRGEDDVDNGNTAERREEERESLVLSRYKRNIKEEESVKETSKIEGQKQRGEMATRLLKELEKMYGSVRKLNKSNNESRLESSKVSDRQKSVMKTKTSGLTTSLPSSKSPSQNRKREATFHIEDSGTIDDPKENKKDNEDAKTVPLDDNINSGDESQDITIVEPDSSLVRMRIVRFIKMFTNFFTYAVIPISSGLFNIMKTLVSNYRTLQSKNLAEGENGFTLFGNGANAVTESSSGFNGFDFSSDLKSINDEAESQQAEITTKKTTKVTTSSSSKSTEAKTNKSSETKDKDKEKQPATTKPTSKPSKSNSSKSNSKSSKSSKKDQSKTFDFDPSKIDHNDFDFDENLIPRFRRQDKKNNTTESAEAQSTENENED